MKQVHPVFEMFYSKERESFVDTVDMKQVHLVFEMFYSKERESHLELRFKSTLSIRSRFIWYSKCSTRKREKVIWNEGLNRHCRYEAG